MSINDWYEIEIVDPEYLSGKSCRRLFNHLLQSKREHKVRWVELDELIGAVDNALDNEAIYPLDKAFFEQLVKVIQFDWGDFYFLTKPQSVLEFESYPERIRNCAFMVRCVDDTYWFVYLRTDAEKDQLLELYPNAKVQRGELEDFIYMW